MSTFSYSRPVDESIQSYIFRKFVVNGENDYSTIIAKNGHWKIDFRLSPHQFEYFSNEDEQHLYILVRENYSGMVKERFFGNPLYIKGLVSYVFYNQNANGHDINFKGEASFLSKKSKAKFCIKCIRDSLYRYGYGYFKSSWYYDIVCSEHQTPLLIINSASYSESINDFRQIISGKAPSNFTLAEADYRDMRLGLHDDLFQSYVAPCLLELAVGRLRHFVSKYFRADEDLSDEKVEFVMKYLDQRLFYSAGGYKKVKFAEVADGFRSLLRNKYAPVVKFLNESIEIAQGSMGIKSVNSICLPIAVSANRNCKKCTATDKICVLSPVIEMFVNPQKVELSGGNYCDRVNAAYRKSDYCPVEFINKTNFLDDSSSMYWNIKYKGNLRDLHYVFRNVQSFGF